jgi:hypothetical protein
MSTDEPRDHVIRAKLPWRTYELTECGRPVADVASVITIDQLKWRIKDHGKQRTAFTVCMTCWTASNAWPGAFDTDPAGVLLREYRRQGTRAVANEVRAIAALIEAHSREFDALMTGLDGAADFAARRARRRTR